MKRSLWLALGLLLAASLSQAQQKPVDLDVQFRSAERKETVDGDLNGAIEQYRQIVAQAGSNRSIAVKALLRMAECYQKQGNVEARRIYERVLREYPEQRDAATVAQARLGGARAEGGGEAANSAAPTLRRLWEDASGSGAPTRDGRFLTFADRTDGRLGVRDLTTGESRYLTAKPDRPWQAYALGNVPSPDGRQVAYTWYNDQKRVELRLIELRGGEPTVLFAQPETEHVAPKDWSPDGRQLLVFVLRKDRMGQIALLSVPDGRLRALKTLGWRGAPGRMAFSPDGKFVVYAFPSRDDSDQRDLRLLATDGSSESVLIGDPANDEVIGWSPDGGYVLFASDRSGRRSMYAVPVSNGRASGSVLLVRRDADVVQPLGFTENGTFLYAAASPSPVRVYTASLDTAGHLTGSPVSALEQVEAWASQWSRKGTSLAYATNNPGDAPGVSVRLVVRALETGTERAIPPGNLAYAFGIRWSPRDDYLMISGQDRKGSRGVFRLDPATGEATMVLPGSESGFAGWSGDGRSVIYRHDSSSFSAMVERNLETGEERELHRVGVGRLGYPQVSPDGLVLAFFQPDTANASTGALKVVGLSGGEPREVARITGGFSGLAWSPNDARLYFLQNRPGSGTGSSGRSALLHVPVSGGEVRQTGLEVSGGVLSFQMHPNGRAVAFSGFVGGTPGQMDVWAMTNFLPPAEKKH